LLVDVVKFFDEFLLFRCESRPDDVEFTSNGISLTGVAIVGLFYQSQISLFEFPHCTLGVINLPDYLEILAFDLGYRLLDQFDLMIFVSP
jgi:hypothetical protein